MIVGMGHYNENSILHFYIIWLKGATKAYNSIGSLLQNSTDNSTVYCVTENKKHSMDGIDQRDDMQ